MGCRNPAAAVHGDSFALPDAETLEAGAQLVGREEPAVGGEVVSRRGADGAGDVPGDGIDGFVLAPEPLGSSGIEQRHRRAPR